MYFPDKISGNPFLGLSLKTFSVLTSFLFSFSQEPFAQLSDNFSDGDFAHQPGWAGTDSLFIINSSYQLQLNAAGAGVAFLYAEFFSSEVDDLEWEIFVKQSFSPSGGNFGRYYLMSDGANLAQPLNGYYLQFGEAGSNDAVELFRQSGSTSVSVCRAAAAKIASAFAIRVKVIRNNSGLWHLYIDYSGGVNYTLEASGSDAIHTSCAYAGVMCTFTVSNASGFYYDDISIRPITIPDTISPALVSVEAISSETLELVFSEKIDSSSARNILNYFLTSSQGHPESVVLQPDHKSVRLLFPIPFQNGHTTSLTIRNVEDLSGNVMLQTEEEFSFFLPMPLNFRDIIITEVFPDPSPQVGLPAAEFVEIFNRSENPVELDGWTFSDGVSTGVLPSALLLPGNFMVLCSSTSLQEYAQFGPALPVSNFPTLNNASDYLVLRDSSGGVVLDSLNYFSSWYKDEDKASGGWSLERIDPEDVCRNELNWIASFDPAGGTPGKQNSAYAVLPDTDGPRVIEAIQLSATVVQLIFTEKLAAGSVSLNSFTIEPSLQIESVFFSDEGLAKVHLQLASEIDSLIAYKITAEGVYDCPGNIIDPAYNKVYLNQDVIAPLLLSARASSSTTVRVAFSEKISPASALLPSNYQIVEWGHPESVVMQGESSVILSYKNPFANGYNRTLMVYGITDLAGNFVDTTVVDFLYYQGAPVAFRDVIITEIYADPSPSRGLPDAEFVELHNRSVNPADLSGWTLSDESNAEVFGFWILQPGEYVIVSSSSTAEKFELYGKVATLVRLPPLNNSGDILTLKDPTGKTIDSLQYATEWYGDNEKEDGGWSLELIDPENICADRSNWTSTEADEGGTPGKVNSVNARKPDNTGPEIVSVVAREEGHLIITFNEKLEKRIPAPEQFSIEPKLSVSAITFTNTTLTALSIFFSEQIRPGKTYRLTAKNIYDCSGNEIKQASSSALFILPQQAEVGDIVINEVLFNPRPTGVDFIEIYNRSEKVVNLENWSIRNFMSDGELMYTIGDDPLLILPKEYMVFTEKAALLKGEYIMGVEERFIETNLPRLSNDNGSVALLDHSFTIIDSMLYDDAMHSRFLQNTEGVSLERISLAWEAAEAANWRSASSVAGFATPGYLNSNLRPDAIMEEGSVMVEPEILQTNGASSFAFIRYRFGQAGFIANVKIYDSQGRPIREVARNELLGREGFFRWDGDQQDGSRARIGYYLVWFEIFDGDGMLKTFKKRVALY